MGRHQSACPACSASEFETGQRSPLHWPLPPKLMTCGLPGTLSVILSVAFLTPVVFGAKVTTTEQLDPGTSMAGDTGQVVVSAKSPASAPLIVGFLTEIGVPLGLPIVTVIGWLLTPTFSTPKFNISGKIPMTGRLSRRETEPE